jgi:hypothetical protein
LHQPGTRQSVDRNSLVYAAGAGAILFAFAFLRLPLLLARDPFFDELFTVWIARQETGRILEALLVDSGPPLYYLLVRALLAWSFDLKAGIDLVTAVRFFSLTAALIALLSVLFARRLGPSRYIAALLLVIYPPHLYFSTEARSYALCSLFTGLGALLLDRWLDDGKTRTLALASAALIAAAYTHYYGVLFFPVPFVLALLNRRRREVPQALAATVALAVFYAPGFWLVSRQPAGAMQWMQGREGGLSEALSVAIRHLGIAAPYPAGLLTAPPLWLQYGSLLVVVATVAFGLVHSPKARSFGLMALLPLLGALLFVATGRPAYFPMRFEAVTAVPFVLMLSFAMAALPLQFRRVVLAVIVAAGAWVSWRVIADRTSWPDDPYRQTAEFARQALLDQSVPIVASGPQYLEVISRLDGEWKPLVVSFPFEQGEHPGWRATLAADRLDGDRARLLPSVGDRFVWMGEWGSEEMRSLTRVLGSTVIFRRDPVAVLIMSGDGVQEQEQKHQRQPADEEQPDPGPGP